MPTTFASNFVIRTRDDGVPYVTLAEDVPAWLRKTVRDAHLDTLPSDWVYAECKAAVEAFDEGTFAGSDDDDDCVHDHADSRVEVYTQALYQWAADHCLTEIFAAAKQEAMDVGLPEDTEDRIKSIQYAAIHHIADTMRQACIAAAREQTGMEPA
jgi:hypothetical protein